MARVQTKGSCRLCGKEFTRGGMRRHLQKCAPEYFTNNPSTRGLLRSDEDAWLCEKCVKKHKCEEDYFLPVVNSPRVGVCGYTGEADIETDEELW